MSMTPSRPHYWQGEWIDESELEHRLAHLHEWIHPELQREPDIEAILRAAQFLSTELAQSSGTRTRLERELVESASVREDEAAAALTEISALLSRPSLESKLRRELGSTRPFTAARIGYDQTVFESWAPLGLLVHISPQNSFGVGPMSVLEGLLSGNVNFLKTGAGESLFPQLFLEALCGADPSGLMAKRVIAARISSKRQDLLARVYAECDGVAAWGGEESVAAIRQSVPSGVRVVEWGHKISFVYVTQGALGDSVILDAVAAECCSLEQQACSSPQCVYVETSEFSVLRDFAHRLSGAMARVSPGIPRVLPGDAEAGEISMVTQCHRLEVSFSEGAAEVIEAEDGSWRILVDHRSPLVASPLFRSAWVKPLPRAEIVSTLRPMRRYLQTAGLACRVGDAREITRNLVAAGVDRVRRIGEMLGSYTGEPHDGVYALTRYCRRISLQLGEDSRGISNFRELTAPESWDTLKELPITPKESFTNEPSDPARARLFFKSGGSTGEPKLSTYDYDQYHAHMRLGADGLVAAGFDPIIDRAINLFYSGNLYGGFLSIFSTLETLGAVQFPMAAQPDHGAVAKTIISNQVNTLLGMPSYLLQLFEAEAESFARYRGVRKIFYGGEHFSEAQLRYLKEKFGVQEIRSLAYGSVDIGPIGYQCGESEGGVHHLHHGALFLEILKMDEDRPVYGDEVGRLIFSPREADSNKPLRYEIGDVGQWIQESRCPCGRASPRFRLMGRMGDIFRIGTFFLNYQKISAALSAGTGFQGEIQLCLENEGMREKLIVLISREAACSAESCRTALIENYPEMREAVEGDKTLLLEVREVEGASMERTPSSGKLRHVLDRRVRA